MTVLNTNVVSEALKPDPEGKVVAWLRGQQRSEAFITSITQAEVLYGVDSLPEGKRKSGLANDIENLLLHEFQGRVLPFDEKAVRSRNAVLATRNIKDFEHCGVNPINPWEA